MEKEIFWADKTARQVIEREKQLKRFKVLRAEMGMGASGIPHIGSVGDGVRSYAVYLGMLDLGAKAQFIAFSDDRDGLRKVPAGFPHELESELGKPVSQIPDHFGCHRSFGEHVTSLLIDAFKKVGVKFTLKRASAEYPKGTLDKQIIKILDNANLAGQIIQQTTGSEKFLKQLPFWPICEKCGRIYTTRAYKWDSEKKRIYYKCDGEFTGKNINTEKTISIRGCGHEGICSIRDGKLPWKVEFAARWAALKIAYEAYGKDLADSVKCNIRIAKEILNYEPPIMSFYELFVERGGKKISKSAGNVFTPQQWLRYASPLSVRLLFLKKLAKTRVVDADAIPAYEDEVDYLTKVYFGDIKIKNPKELAHLKRLYEYIHFLKPPKTKPRILIPYNVLAGIAAIVPQPDVIIKILQKTDHVPEDLKKDEIRELKKRIARVKNWVHDTERVEKVEGQLNQKQLAALHQLAQELKTKTWTEEALYARLYEIARENALTSQEFFKGAYIAILGTDRGPRLAPLILAIGPKKVAKKLESFKIKFIKTTTNHGQTSLGEA